MITRSLLTALTVSAGVGASLGVFPVTSRGQAVASATEHSAIGTQRITVNIESAPLADAIRVIARAARLSPSYNTALVENRVRVTLHLRDVPAIEAFREALRGTGLTAEIHATGKVFIVVNSAGVVSGDIRGTVIDAGTKRPVVGATIVLEGTKSAVRTGEDGTYRLVNVPAGSHTIAIRRIGYSRMRRTVALAEGQSVSADFELEASANALDQVVVTGTVVATELKAVPNAITVITAKQIQERGITHIDQLFRGDVPGLFAVGARSNEPLDKLTMFSRGATALGASAGTFNGTNAIKTYVDGIEMADPRYLSQIDPGSIERIEILSGPQASTIYGSNALNGVMQVFTKRGASAKPQLTLNLLSGWVENNFRPSKTPQHDYSAQVNGVESRLSYNAGGSWNYMGPWTPAKKTTRTSIYGGARFALPTSVGGLTADVSFRRGDTKNTKQGSNEQGVIDDRERGWRLVEAGIGSDIPWQKDALRAQMVGTTLGYTPTSWWSHELGIGLEALDEEVGQTKENQIFSQRDSLLYFRSTQTEKRSLRYTTTARVPLMTLGQATVTLGADTRQEFMSSMWGYMPKTFNGWHSGLTLGRQPGHNTGGFLQAQLGIRDRLFLTYGLRAEWNPDFGDDASPNYAPRYGIAYTADVGPVTTKLRASYGRSTRPPALDQKAAWASTDAGLISVYGPYNTRLANPMLGPEHQQGGEGGLEVYFGNRASFVVTRYNQTVDGLITDVPGVDSVRSLKPNPQIPVFFWTTDCADMIRQNNTSACSSQDEDGYGYAWQSRNMNGAGIRNQGWELQGSVVLGPLTTRGTYSWTKSRSMGVTPEFRNVFASRLSYMPQYRPGATFQFLPEHTWSVGMTYAQSQTTVAITLMGVGQLRNSVDEFYLRNLDGGIRLYEDQMRVRNNNAYVSHSAGYMQADLTATHRFQSHVEGLLVMQNFGNHYTQDYSARGATLGRQTKLGFRIRL